MKVILKNEQTKNIILLLIIGLFGFLSIKLFTPYIDILLLAFIIVQIFHPFYEYIFQKTKSKSLATTLSVLVALIIVIVGVAIVIILTYGEVKNYLEGNNINNLLNKIQDFANSIINSIDDLLKRFNFNKDTYITPLNLSNSNYGEILKDSFNKFQKDNINLPQQVISTGVEVIYIIGTLLFTFFMLLFSLIYLFPNYEKLSEQFNKISPLDKRINTILFSKFINTVKGTIKGTFLVALIQATVMIIPMILMGVGAPALLWLIMVVVSIIPIGSGLVWVPVCLLTIFTGISTGNPVQSLFGVLLLIYGTIMVNIIDTALRSNLIKDSLDLHPLVTIFSILGGLVLFGFYGVLYGPLIVVIFLTVVEIYKEDNIQSNKETLHENLS